MKYADNRVGTRKGNLFTPKYGFGTLFWRFRLKWGTKPVLWRDILLFFCKNHGGAWQRAGSSVIRGHLLKIHMIATNFRTEKGNLFARQYGFVAQNAAKRLKLGDKPVPARKKTDESCCVVAPIDMTYLYS
jgi:hypothetical protein